jgi:hypothetical protein
MTASAFRKNIRDNIARYGRAVICVFPDEDSADKINDAFAYTIGNSASGLPELLVIGMFDNTAKWLLNTLAEKMLERRGRFENYERIDLGGAHPVAVVLADQSVQDRYTIQVENFLQHHYDVMQVVLPDKAGKFPWDEGCAEPFGRVVVHARVPAAKVLN